MVILKKAELRKDEEKMVHQNHQRQALEGTESTAELFVGREVLRAGLTSLRASFTVSPQAEQLGCVGFLWFVCWGGFCCFFVSLGIPFFWSIAFDAQRCHSSKTVHHRHAGAKKKAGSPRPV